MRNLIITTILQEDQEGITEVETVEVSEETIVVENIVEVNIVEENAEEIAEAIEVVAEEDHGPPRNIEMKERLERPNLSILRGHLMVETLPRPETPSEQ
jgi:hypothetical protein